MVLTHPVVNQDRYPFDFQVFDPFKNSPDLSQMKLERRCSNAGRSPRRFFWRGTVDWCVKGMAIEVVMEIFQIVFLSLPRSISKWVSVEQDEYLNYSDLYRTYFPLNI